MDVWRWISGSLPPRAALFSRKAIQSDYSPFRPMSKEKKISLTNRSHNSNLHRWQPPCIDHYEVNVDAVVNDEKADIGALNPVQCMNPVQCVEAQAILSYQLGIYNLLIE
ncbi:hypothetical protein M9H77_19455 [Catharanthus roseus]|uniref:Uncharacterized protein n=1 Tax=Catharanthus roseus TaxID=4058 RepID=A0ACC0BAD7_CATRO|nr:hypothetical protein M9H77_19455 [Catharanthus roseus]